MEIPRLSKLEPCLLAGTFLDVSSMETLRSMRVEKPLADISGQSDPGSPRTLNEASYTDGSAMTIESCTSYCVGKGYVYAGVEYADECCKF